MAGRVRLDTAGIQDIYITENPTYSHFLDIFKQHTMFAFDVRENPLNDAVIGQETICIIPVDVGDLLTNVTLRYQLFARAPPSDTFTDEDPFTPNVGIHAIEYADLFIGGVRIERLTGDWIYLYHKYHASDYNFRDSIIPLTTAKDEPYGRDEKGEWTLRQMYIDLPFYFYNNLTSSVLLCKLGKQDCQVRIKFKEIDALVQPYLAQYPVEARIQTASLLTTYAYVGDQELSYLQHSPADQLITQIQLKKHDIPRTKDEDDIPLRFYHPVKTMYVVAGKKSRRFSYAPGTEVIQYMLNAPFKTLRMTLNNTILFDESFSKLGYENSLTNAVSGIDGDVSFLGGTSVQLPTRDRIASYSFALYPLDNAPSGHLNFSRIIDQSCHIVLDYSDDYSAEQDDITEVQIYAKSYNILHYSSGLCGLRY